MSWSENRPQVHDARTMGQDHPPAWPRRRLLAAAVLAAGGLLGRRVSAQAEQPVQPAQPTLPRWPTRAIRILLVYPPGGVSDTILRLLADQLS